jgi:hypothetical protein
MEQNVVASTSNKTSLGVGGELIKQKVGTSTANRANRIWRGTKRKERRNRASEVFGNSGKKK